MKRFWVLVSSVVIGSAAFLGGIKTIFEFFHPVANLQISDLRTERQGSLGLNVSVTARKNPSAYLTGCRIRFDSPATLPDEATPSRRPIITSISVGAETVRVEGNFRFSDFAGIAGDIYVSCDDIRSNAIPFSFPSRGR